MAQAGRKDTAARLGEAAEHNRAGCKAAVALVGQAMLDKMILLLVPEASAEYLLVVLPA